MKFNDSAICKKERFSIGKELETGKYYLSIPVSNGLVDYEEYYEISKDSFDRYLSDMESALEFVRGCRGREYDRLLIINPGKNRGTAI